MQLIDKTTLARMPWHDMSLGMLGGPVLDVVRHACERWNFIKVYQNAHKDNRVKILLIYCNVGLFRTKNPWIVTKFLSCNLPWVASAIAKSSNFQKSSRSSVNTFTTPEALMVHAVLRSCVAVLTGARISRLK